MTEPLTQLVTGIESHLAPLDHPGAAEVRAGLARRSTLRPIEPADNPVIAAHLPAALDALSRNRHADLAAAIAAAAPALAWTAYDKYPPAAIGERFRAGHAYASLVGPTGPFAAGDYDLGLFLIAPGVFYRDHRHAAPELYAPLTGPHGWRFGPGDPLAWLPAHVPVWNPPRRPHATKAGRIPFLCIYAWTRDVAEPAVIVEADDWPELD
jgi:Dimethlysulfonioproprionate lyase